MSKESKNLVIFCGSHSSALIKMIDAIVAELSKKDYPIRIAAIIGNVDHVNNKADDELTIVEFAQTHQVPFVRLVKGVANNPIFLDELFRRFSPDWAMSIYCMEVFSEDFIQRFEQVINYHNGALPKYRGVRATNWAIANGESEAGWRFHRITKEVDCGNILLGGTVEITPDESPASLETKLFEQASLQISNLLTALLQNEPGEAQVGESSYYSFHDAQRARLLSAPNRLTARQLINHIRAFAPVIVPFSDGNLSINQAHLVNEESQHVNKKGHHRVISSDGLVVELV